MADVFARDVAYELEEVSMRGMLVAPERAVSLPTVVLIHDAFGLSDDMVEIAEAIAGRGYVVFLADVWGDRMLPHAPTDIGPLIGAMVGNRSEWIARIARAHAVAAAQPEVDGEALVTLGYCFGGASALEYLRTGGSVLGVVSLHGGLDLLEFDWSEATATHAAVLICTGARDPMATPEQRGQLQEGLDAAGIEWEVDLYSWAVHAFTSKKSQNSPAPHLFAYDERAAARSWAATLRFLDDTFGARVV